MYDQHHVCVTTYVRFALFATVLQYHSEFSATDRFFPTVTSERIPDVPHKLDHSKEAMFTKYGFILVAHHENYVFST
jgi:hypothetical protein